MNSPTWQYQRLQQRRDWLDARQKAKASIGWDNQYDIEERDALSWALEQLAERDGDYAPREEWRFKLAYLDPCGQDIPTRVGMGIWQERGCLTYTFGELEVEQHDPTETRRGTDAAGG